MGEKGNAASTVALAVGAGDSLIERVTTTATETVTGVGQDFVEVLRDKSIGAVADNTIAAARERLHRKTDEEPEDSGEASAPGGTPDDPSA